MYPAVFLMYFISAAVILLALTGVSTPFVSLTKISTWCLRFSCDCKVALQLNVLRNVKKHKACMWFNTAGRRARLHVLQLSAVNTEHGHEI